MTTPHNHQVVFGRKVDSCPRCQELKAGAAPVAGWGANKRASQVQLCREIRNHDCKTSRCGPICTFGDW